MTKDECFAHAITLAAGFVANGDIRIGLSINEGNTAMSRLDELIPSLFDQVEAAYQKCGDE